MKEEHPQPSEHGPSAVDGVLRRLRSGDRSAWEELMPLVYGELHSIARREMARQSTSHTLQPTALVNEAFMKLCRSARLSAQEHGDFLRLCAAAMRSILTDHARAKLTAKRKMPGQSIPISDALDLAIQEQWRRSQITVLELSELLDRYAQFDPVGARLVELRYFAGRTVEEAAAALDVAPRTAQRIWNAARAWLKRELSK